MPPAYYLPLRFAVHPATPLQALDWIPVPRQRQLERFGMTTVEELLTLVVKGAKVTHESGSHDDHACALALAVNAAAHTIERRGMRFVVGDRVLTTDEYKAMQTPIHDPENPNAVTACVKGGY